jgi:hypothetical protein
MKKAVFAVLLLLPTWACAEWKSIAESGFGRMSYDTASVKRQGERVQMRYRIDYSDAVKVPSGPPPRSVLIDAVLDCKARNLGVVAVATYTQPEGKGEVIARDSHPDPKMDPVQSGSSGVPLLKAACGENTEPHPAAAAAPAPGKAPPAPAKPAAPAGK